jgi:hypothetical protein
MASVRERTWSASSGEFKTAWVIDYADNRGAQQESRGRPPHQH